MRIFNRRPKGKARGQAEEENHCDGSQDDYRYGFGGGGRRDVPDLAGPRAKLLGEFAARTSVKCVGGNSCKGQSSCKSASNGCMGQNSCKGKGWVTSTSAEVCTEEGGKPEKTPTKAM